MSQSRHPQRELYFDHGDPRPERAWVYAELEAVPPLTPPRVRPLSPDDDLGLDRHQVNFLISSMI